jgi:hypothetical protein
LSALDQHRGGRLSCHFRWLRGRCETEEVKNLIERTRPALSGQAPMSALNDVQVIAVGSRRSGHFICRGTFRIIAGYQVLQWLSPLRDHARLPFD